MLSSQRNPHLIILLVLLLAGLACRLPETATFTPTSPTNTAAATTTDIPTAIALVPVNTMTPTARPTAPPVVTAHRIAIHRIYGLAEFYDRSNMSHFIPRGVNYFMLVPVLDHYEDRLMGVGIYDHNRTQADFIALAEAGYNTVRISVDGCTSGTGCTGIEGGQGLNPDYLDNLVDLLKLAKSNNLFVFLASQGLPSLGGYAAAASQGSSASFAPGQNTNLLTHSGIHASQQYWSDLLGSLASRQAPFEVILGWELLSEQYYDASQPPFSLQNGRVNAANGKYYEMANAVQKQALAVEGLRYYIEQIKQTILFYDPTALVSMGFLAPDAPNPWREGDQRYVITAPLLEDSSLDFFDLHASPGADLTLAQAAQNFGLSGHISKPVIMGDVGASTWSYPQVSEAAIAVQDWIASSCAQGFAGWIYSAYYPLPAGLQDATWGFVDEHNTLLNALAPKYQPDACAVTVLPGRNLALVKPVQVSAALPDQTPEMAVDGDPNTQWSAGAFPMQWIEIDLGAAYTIGEIRLTVGQWPAGPTVHQLWVGSSHEAMRMLKEFAGQEFDFDILDYIPTASLTNIRFVRVVTTESPSWVSWREIEVLAPFQSKFAPTVEIVPTP